MASTTKPRRSDVQTTITDETTLDVAIIEAIADAKEIDPTTVDLQLSNYIDLDALTTLYTYSSTKEDVVWEIQPVSTS